MTREKLVELYDALCYALTDYEGNGSEEDRSKLKGNGEELYCSVVKIVNALGAELY